MEFILSQQPRNGLKVYYDAPPQSVGSSGVYTVVEAGEYSMAGMVVIEDSQGRGYGVSAASLESLEDHEDFKVLALGVDADGVTFLPSEKKLRDFGFTDHREGYWYYSAPVGSNETFNLSIPKKPIGEVLGEPVYSYTESVIDELFGQYAYFGNMKDEFRYPLAVRLSGVLRGPLELGILIHVYPEAYSWKGWPESRPLLGMSSDQDTLEHLRGDVAYPASDEMPTEEPGALVEPLEVQAAPQEAAGDSLSEAKPLDESTLDADILKQVAAAIDSEAKNFEWDSLAHGMTLGEYVAPTAIRTYFAALNRKSQEDS